MARPDWDHYLLTIAWQVAARSTCDRAQVGAVLTRQHRILATGYNGSLPNLPHCDDVGHDILDDHCVRTIHAEVNAIAQAAFMGHSTAGAILYCTHYPCWNCYKLAAAAGIQEIVYSILYSPERRIQEAVSRGACRIRRVELRD